MFPIYNENTYIRIQYCTLKYRVKLRSVRLLAIQDSHLNLSYVVVLSETEI